MTKALCVIAEKLLRWLVCFFTDNLPIYNREISHDDLIQEKRETVRIERTNVANGIDLSVSGKMVGCFKIPANG